MNYTTLTMKLKSLLVLLAVIMAGVNCAWAQKADETYDFAGWASSHFSITYGSAYGGTGLTNAYYWDIIGDGNTINNVKGRFASRADKSGEGWYLRDDKTPYGLWNYGSNHNPELAICNLYAGDQVIVTFSGLNMKFVTGNARLNGTVVTAGETILTNKTSFTAESNGDIIIIPVGVNNYDTQITKIEIYYSNNRVYNFKGVQTSEYLTPGGQVFNLEGDGYKLDFINPLNGSKSYDNSFNHPDNHRFFIHDSGWEVGVDGLRYNGSNSSSNFYITEVKKGDIIKVNYSGSGGVVFESTETSGQAWDAPMTSGTEYTMVKNGNLHLKIDKGIYIESIQIQSVALRFSRLNDTYELISMGYDEPELIVTPSSYSSQVTFSSSNERVAKMMSNTSSDVMFINTGTTIITATLPTSATGLENPITASYTVTAMADEAIWDIRNGNELYFPATNPDTGNPNKGKLMKRKVTSIPYITMEFGNSTAVDYDNMTVVKERDGSVLAANLFDENGWQHIWCTYENIGGVNRMTPHQGTFYIFKPAIGGKLTIYGRRNFDETNENSVILVDAKLTGTSNTCTVDRSGTTYYSYPIPVIKKSGDSHVAAKLSFTGTEATGNEFDLEGGHTYYLYANTQNTCTGCGWQNFYLSGFKYETDFSYPNKCVVWDDTGYLNSDYVQAPGYTHDERTLGSNSYYQALPYSGTGVTYSIECKGNVYAEINTSTGRITSVSPKNWGEVMGGSMIVTASVTVEGVTSKTHYVVTIPYKTPETGKKTWSFNSIEDATELKKNAEDWSVVYKVREYAATRDLKYINVPVLANSVSVKGDNARYLDETAGLLFTADPDGMGTDTYVNRTDYYMRDGVVYKIDEDPWRVLTEPSDIDQALKVLLNCGVNDVYTGLDPHPKDGEIPTMKQNVYVAIYNGTSMTIPSMKAGEYIGIKWNRYVENQGDLMRATNVTDLKDVDITGPFHVGRVSHGGYLIFKVKKDGDVTFTLDQEGWTDIIQVEISKKMIVSDLRLRLQREVGAENSTGASTIFTRRQTGGSSFNEVYNVNYGDIWSQSCITGNNVKYVIKDRTGSLTSDNCKILDDHTLSIGTGCHGRFTIVQEGYDDGYLLDMKEYDIKVYEYDYGFVGHPYTWNMENMGASTSTAIANEQELVESGYNYKYWKPTGTTGKYELQLEPENLISWKCKSAIGSEPGGYISELNGLGIRPANISAEENSIVLDTYTNINDVESKGTGIAVGSATQILTVPAVTSSETVYIRVDGRAPEEAKDADGATIALTSVYDSGNEKVYKATGNGKDLEFYLSSTTVKQVAISKDTKTITDAGYATEARDYNLDFSLNQTLTGNEVTAYKVTGVKSNGQVDKSETSYVPTYVDVTDKVATNGWSSTQECGIDFAPAVVTSDGRSAPMIETYRDDATVVGETGTIMQQTIESLENGNYSVELYANAMFTPDRNGITSTMVDGATDVAYVFANNSEVPIVARRATSTTENGVYALEAEVTDGTLTLGLRKKNGGTNWHTIQIKRLTKGQMQGVLLKANEGNHPLFTWDVNRTSSDMNNNKLIGAITEPTNNVYQKEIINGTTYYNYMLAAKGCVETTKENGDVIVDESNEVNGLGFYLVYQKGALINGTPYTGGKPKANSAYLQLDSYQAQHQGIESGSTPMPVRTYFYIDEEDEATGIQSTIAVPAKKDVWYTLQGVRIDNPAKGLYIRNGKKVFVK